MWLLFCLSRAKLASLFEPDQEAGRGNGMFQYTAPKQPKKGSTPGETDEDVRSWCPLDEDTDRNFFFYLFAATANQNPAGPVPGTPAVLVASAVQAFK